ncbi:MAG: hypothetical protein PHT49_07425 [Desulfovibrionales bacterium]|nr:hypothetical protein [Desulfovibrionales bacterium]
MWWTKVKEFSVVNYLLKNYFEFVLSISLSLLVLGCAPTTYRLYEGPPRLPSEVAFLTGDDNDEIILYKVDGQQLPAEHGPYGRNFLIELLPGKYSITVRWDSGLLYSEKIDLVFNAEAGQTYAVMGPLDKRRAKVKVIGLIVVVPQSMWIDNKKGE